MTNLSNLALSERHGIDILLLPPSQPAARKSGIAEVRRQRDAAVAALQEIVSLLLQHDYRAVYPSRASSENVLGTSKAIAFIGLRRSGACSDVEWEVRASAEEAARLAQMSA